MNVATILTGSRDHDLPTKLAWAIPLERRGHNVFIVGRTNQPYVTCMYDEPYKEYPISLQQDIERWLGLPFKYISSLDWRSFNKRDCSDIKKMSEVNQYLTFLTIWFQDFYIKNKIDVLTFQMESFPWNLIGYYVARKLNIPVVDMKGPRFPKKGMMFGNNDHAHIWGWNDAPDPSWEEILSYYQEKKFLRFEGGLQSLWSPKNIQNNLSKALHYVKTKRTMETISPYEKTALLPLQSEIYRALWSTLKGIINPLFWKQPLEEEYLFYPFHYEDDASLTVLEPLTNQIDLVNSISRCLPIGVKLYIKPHPAFMGTDIRFLDLLHLSKLPNVRIIHPTVSPVSLIKNSIGVITINSTTGFEAMIQGKPVITVGNDFYCNENYCYVVKDWGDLPRVISGVCRDRKPQSTAEVTQNFIKSIYKNIVFTQGDIFFAEDPLTTSDGERIAFALDKIYKKL